MSQAIIDAAGAGQGTPGVEFHDIGPIELKGVAGTVQLHAVKRMG